ncbi:hypothetical protein PHLCEN_2v876 [Hermanssonia centrifuga]|uniref:Uncharacterized protein n=1 Tax=Hermanssonia centrifuga TaxID=98765 RepID=A0A2R6S4V8_9APHY|nr:hypothetical protein PHLCEN_2v876 [Hermanssonia centrifuga]
MDRLQALRAEIDALSISEGTITSGTTAVGIGSSSGRVIMSLGELTLRGMRSLNLRVKLRNISVQLSQADEIKVPDETYNVLLELQRTGLYSNAIRFAAWDIILREMEQLRTEALIRAILRWPWIEIQIFIRQLELSRLSGWELYPGSPVKRNVTVVLGYAEAASKSFYAMIKAVIEFSCLQEPVDLEQIVLIQDSAPAPLVLMLEREKVDIFIRALLQHTSPQIELYLRELVLSRLAFSGWMQRALDLRQIIENLLKVLKSVRAVDSSIVKNTLDVTEITPFLIVAMADTSTRYHDKPLYKNKYRAVISVISRAKTAIDLQWALFLLEMQEEPIVLMMSPNAIYQFIGLVRLHAPSKTQHFFQHFVFSKTPKWEHHSRSAYPQMVANIREISRTLGDLDASPIRNLSGSKHASPFLRDRRVLSTIVENLHLHDLPLLAAFLDMTVEPIILALSDHEIKNFINVLVQYPTSEVDKWFRRLILDKSFVGVQDLEHEDVVENNVIRVLLTIWKHKPSTVHGLLTDVQISNRASNSMVHNTSRIVSNIKLCILIAILGDMQDHNYLDRISPFLKQEPVPAILLTRQAGIKAFTAALKQYPLAEASRLIDELILSKLWTCIHQPRGAQNRIVTNLLEVVHEIWRYDASIVCKVDNVDAVISLLPNTTISQAVLPENILQPLIILAGCYRSDATSPPLFAIGSMELAITQLSHLAGSLKAASLPNSPNRQDVQVDTSTSNETKSPELVIRLCAEIWITLRWILSLVSLKFDDILPPSIHQVLFELVGITPNQRGAVIMYTMDGPPNHSVAHVAVGRMESAACDLLSAEIQRGNIGESILSVLALVNNSATSAVVLREMSEGTKLRRVN